MTLEERVAVLEQKMASMEDETPRRDTGEWMPKFVEFVDPGPKMYPIDEKKRYGSTRST